MLRTENDMGVEMSLGQRAERGNGSVAGSSAETVEALNAEIYELVIQRQQLRGNGGTKTRLEQNRLELVRLQRQLSYRLIERYAYRRAPLGAA